MSEQNNSPDGLSTALSSILSNPEMMSMISSMASKLKDDGGIGKADAEDSAKESDVQSAEVFSNGATSSIMQTLAPLLSASAPSREKKDNDRICLLRALKPYLSQGRGQAIDYIIKFSSLGDLMKNLS